MPMYKLIYSKYVLIGRVKRNIQPYGARETHEISAKLDLNKNYIKGTVRI